MSLDKSAWRVRLLQPGRLIDGTPRIVGCAPSQEAFQGGILVEHQIINRLGAARGGGCLSGCYPPGQGQYPVEAIEQPQPVHFFYGTLIDIRPATIEPGREAGIGAALSFSPWLAGLHAGGYPGSAELRVSAAFVDIPLIGSVPNLPATEYTVMPDYGTNPPDPYVRAPGAAAVIVVQNDDRGDAPMRLGQHVVVRVVGNSGRVMANPLPPAIEARLSAGPLPIPLPADGGPSLASAVVPPLPDSLPSCITCRLPTFYFNPL